MKTAKRTFISGVIVLTAANLITKIIGLVFKIPLTNMLGNEGMGYFNTAYQIYTWLYMISTAGLPVALSLMVSEFEALGENEKAGKLFKTVTLVFGAVGLTGSLLMLFFSDGISFLISADKASFCITAISPALFFVCISSTVRGYFQGKRNMIPTAVSEIIEAFFKLSAGILLGSYALKKGYPLYVVAAYSIFGITIGIVLGAVFLLIYYFIKKKQETFSDNKIINTETDKKQIPSGKLMGSFLKIALPVMLSSSLLSMSSMLDTMIVIRRLQNLGLTPEASLSLYGNYTAYCVTLFNLPPVLIYPIVSALIPTISAYRAEGNLSLAFETVQRSLKLAALIALPCALGLSAMSLPVLKLIFSSEESAVMASPLLSALAPSIFLIGMMAVTNGVLSSYRLQLYSVISMFAGALVKGISAYLLAGVKLGSNYLMMYASPISTFLFYLTIICFDLYFITKYTELKIRIFSIVAKPFAASLVCVLFAVGTYGTIGLFIGYTRLCTLLSLFVAVISYLVSLFLFGGITESDIEGLPKAEKLLSFFLKRKKA